jgi:hypothetical protein
VAHPAYDVAKLQLEQKRACKSETADHIIKSNNIAEIVALYRPKKVAKIHIFSNEIKSGRIG